MNLDQALKSNIIDAVSRGDGIKYDYSTIDRLIEYAKAKRQTVEVRIRRAGKRPENLVLIEAGRSPVLGAAQYDELKDEERVVKKVVNYIKRHSVPVKIFN